MCCYSCGTYTQMWQISAAFAAGQRPLLRHLHSAAQPGWLHGTPISIIDPAAPALQVLKERFEAFVPALSRWGGTTVGLSLIAIGGLGLLELWQDHRAAQAEAQQAQQQQVAFEGAIIGQPCAAFALRCRQVRQQCAQKACPK